MDASTGAFKWQTRVADDTGGSIFDPLVYRDTVYVGYLRRTIPRTGGVGAIDAKSGARLWFREFVQGAEFSATSSHGDAKIANDLVIAASDGGEIYALERASGAVRWVAPRVPLPAQTRDDTRPLAVVGQVVVAGSSGGMVTGYNAANGAKLWEVDLQGGSIVSPFVSDDRRVFIVDYGGNIVALEAATGAIAWRFGLRSDGLQYEILGYPALSGDTLFVGGTKAAFALRAYDDDN